MRNFVSIILPLCLFLFSSCVKSNEDKAEALVKEKLKTTLFHPDTYKAVSTRVDSAFFNGVAIGEFGKAYADLIELLRKEEQYETDMERAQSGMEIMEPSDGYASQFMKGEYERRKLEFGKLQAKQRKILPKIEVKISEMRKYSKQVYSHEQTGWIVEHKFTSNNGKNTVGLPGDKVFICDKDFTQCSEGVDKDDFEKLLKLIDRISHADTNEDVRELIEDRLSVF